MTRPPHISAPPHIRIALAVVLVGLLAALAAIGRPSGRSPAEPARSTRSASPTTISTQPPTWSYGWPVKPFDRQHPVRAFSTTRASATNGGTGSSTSASTSRPRTGRRSTRRGRNGLPRHPRRRRGRLAGRPQSFGYWHIVPAVTSHQLVGRTVIGRIEKRWAHVHFAERVGGVYVNPCATAASARTPTERAARSTAVSARRAPTSSPSRATRPPWRSRRLDGEPVTPELIRWRVGMGQRGRRRSTPAPRCCRAATSRGLHAGDAPEPQGAPGGYSFYLAHELADEVPAAVEVRASDTRRNSAGRRGARSARRSEASVAGRAGRDSPPRLERSAAAPGRIAGEIRRPLSHKSYPCLLCVTHAPTGRSSRRRARSTPAYACLPHVAP